MGPYAHSQRNSVSQQNETFCVVGVVECLGNGPVATEPVSKLKLKNSLGNDSGQYGTAGRCGFTLTPPDADSQRAGTQNRLRVESVSKLGVLKEIALDYH